MIFGALESSRRVDVRPALIGWVLIVLENEGPKGTEYKFMRQWHGKEI